MRTARQIDVDHKTPLVVFHILHAVDVDTLRYGGVSQQLKTTNSTLHTVPQQPQRSTNHRKQTAGEQTHG